MELRDHGGRAGSRDVSLEVGESSGGLEWGGALIPSVVGRCAVGRIHQVVGWKTGGEAR